MYSKKIVPKLAIAIAVDGPIFLPELPYFWYTASTSSRQILRLSICILLEESKHCSWLHQIPKRRWVYTNFFAFYIFEDMVVHLVLPTHVCIIFSYSFKLVDVNLLLSTALYRFAFDLGFASSFHLFPSTLLT